VIVTPLASRSTRSLRDALLSHGWEGVTSAETAAGMETVSLHCAPLADAALPALVRSAGRLGLEVVTGPDWAVISGARSRLSAFARPWTLPPELADLSLAVAAALPAELPAEWRTARGTLPMADGVVIGILSLARAGADAIESLLPMAEALLEGGATLLDVSAGGRRPGREATAMMAAERDTLGRAVTALLGRWPALLVAAHTAESEVAAAALRAGAAIVNDPSGLTHDPGMASLVARQGAGLMLLPPRVPPAAADPPPPDDGPGSGVLSSVIDALRAGLQRAADGGVTMEQVVVDPGFGLGRTAAANWALLRGLPGLRALGRPICVGPSRKRFLAELPGPPPDADRAAAVVCALAWERGARLFRVHDPAAVRDALRVVSAAGDA